MELRETPQTIDLGLCDTGSDYALAYLRTVGADPERYLERGVFPPLAVTAQALGRLLQVMGLPPGTVHASQEQECYGLIPLGAPLRLTARVERSSRRGEWHFITVSVEAVSDDKALLRSRTTVMVPAVPPPEGL